MRMAPDTTPVGPDHGMPSLRWATAITTLDSAPSPAASDADRRDSSHTATCATLTTAPSRRDSGGYATCQISHAYDQFESDRIFCSPHCQRRWVSVCRTRPSDSMRRLVGHCQDADFSRIRYTYLPAPQYCIRAVALVSYHIIYCSNYPGACR